MKDFNCLQGLGQLQHKATQHLLEAPLNLKKPSKENQTPAKHKDHSSISHNRVHSKKGQQLWMWWTSFTAAVTCKQKRRISPPTRQVRNARRAYLCCSRRRCCCPVVPSSPPSAEQHLKEEDIRRECVLQQPSS